MCPSTPTPGGERVVGRWLPLATLALHTMRHAAAERGHDLLIDHRVFLLELFNQQPTPEHILDAEVVAVGARVPDLEWRGSCRLRERRLAPRTRNRAASIRGSMRRHGVSGGAPMMVRPVQRAVGVANRGDRVIPLGEASGAGSASGRPVMWPASRSGSENLRAGMHPSGMHPRGREPHHRAVPLAPKPSVADVDEAVVRLGLRSDGGTFSSLSSLLRPVTLDGRPAILKVTNEPEELAGVRALERWSGHGAVRVLRRNHNAIVLERAGPSLRSVANSDQDSTAILCGVGARLHARTPTDLHGFPTLQRWFRSLFVDETPRFDPVREIAVDLLARSGSQVLLHGDIHAENVLDGGGRGWLAIDPKGIVGAREFDYCNIFTNWTLEQVIGNFDARLRTVSVGAGIEYLDLLRWIASWSALSGIWHLEGGDEAAAALPHAVTDLALGRLREHDGPQSD